MKYKLRDICSIKVGFPFKSEFFNETGDGIRLVRGMNVSKDGFRWGGQTRWWNRWNDELKEFLLNEYDVLIAMDGNVGSNCALVRKADLPLLLVQRVARLRSEVVPQRLLWFIVNTRDFKEYLNSVKTGTTISHISAKQIGDYEVELPCDDKRLKIAKVLSNIDDKIYVNNQINQNLLEQIDVLFSQSQTSENGSQLRLRDIAGIHKSPFVPEKHPNELLEHYSLPAFDAKGYPSFELSEAIKSNKTSVNKECILVSKLNPEVKRIWKPLCLTENSICSTEFIPIKPYETADLPMVFAILNSVGFSSFLCSRTTGSTNSHQRVSPLDILDYAFIWPNNPARKELNQRIGTLLSLRDDHILENEKLIVLRDSLLPKLMSGEIDVDSVKIS